MGKKTKVGKQRKDKFYHLAKETGYRSRAAFKLIQLNRKFEFLQKSRVLVDLCAAPGGWMQVAVEHMPVSSVVIGVDLFPIKPISGCINIQEDITTPRCLQLLKKELKTWKVDCVLHDGAPNVGQNWLYDAYQQTCLTLSAFKLATELLKPNGYFITKVFRSKDYNSLLWVLQQFFKNVYSTKPAASRIESAEIFVVCKGYTAPHNIDPKFLDPKYVFEEINVAQDGKKQIQTLLSEIGKKKKAEGYPAGATLLYKPITASEFIRSSDYVELLENTMEILLDEEWISNNAKTTQDIKDYCKDVKVLGKKEIKALISWRNVLRAKLEQFTKLKSEELKGDVQESEQIAEVKEIDSDEELKEFDDLADSINKEQLKADKKKRKKLMKDRKKIHDKTNLKMIIPGDVGPTDTSEDTLFNLKSVKSSSELNELTERSQMPAVEEEKELTLEDYENKRRSKTMRFDKDNEILDSSGNYYKKMDSEGEDSGQGSDEDEDPDLKHGLGIDESEDEMEFEEHSELDLDTLAPVSTNPLLTDLDNSDKNQKRLRKAQMWFDKDIFQTVNDESDEDIELNAVAEAFTKKGVKVVGYKNPNEKANKTLATKKRKLEEDEKDKSSATALAPSKKKEKKWKLDAEGMALGSVMIQSKKSKRDLVDEGWNRYAFNDPGLPDWFVADEKKHMKKAVPVPPELVEEYQKNLQEINARPIKKVVEAKARKKKRTIRKFEKAKKKAEAILEKSDMTETEKASQLKQLYKKARVTKKKELTYVVSKKFNSAKRATRPAGVKGHFKVVDPRMKKDLRKMKQMGGKGNKKGKGGKSKSKSSGKTNSRKGKKR